MTTTRSRATAAAPDPAAAPLAHRRFRALGRLATGVLALALGVSSVPPAFALVDRATIDLDTAYLIRARLSYATGTISASQVISIRNRAPHAVSKVNLSVLPRGFGELTSLGGVTIDGRATTTRWTNNANLEVQLGRDLAPGASVTLRLNFAVRATSRIDTSLHGRLSKANGIMQVSHWFPIVSDGHGARYPGDSQYTLAARRIRLELRTDDSRVRIAAPGTVVSSSGTYHVYEITGARDFAFGASPYYRTLLGSSAGVTVAVYYTTGDAAAAMATTKRALAVYESAYGQYQWGRLVVAQTGRPTSGNEYPGIVFIGGRLFGNKAVIAHEVAHQWWYAMVGNDQLREPWLDEGLAEFSTNYFFANFRSYVSDRPVNSPVYDFPNTAAQYTTWDPHSYDQTVYFKGAVFLNGLRSRMGTTAFFAGLRDLFAANRGGVVTTPEFVATMLRYGAPQAYLDQFLRS